MKISKGLFSIILVVLIGIQVNAQATIGMRWAKNVEANQFNFQQDSNFRYVLKSKSRLLFFDSFNWKPLSVNTAGLIEPYTVENLWYFEPKIFGYPALEANNKWIRKITGVYQGGAPCINYFSSFSRHPYDSPFFSDPNLFTITHQDQFKVRADKNYNVVLKTRPQSHPCSSEILVFSFISYSKTYDVNYSIQTKPFSYYVFRPAPNLSFSTVNRPVLSFWNSDSLNWNGTSNYVSQPGFSHFEIGDSGSIISKYHTPIMDDISFWGKFEFGDKSLLLQLGKRYFQGNKQHGEISRIDSFGQKLWTIRDSLINNFSSVCLDPVGNGLYTFLTNDSMPKTGFLALDKSGNQLWKHIISNSQNIRDLNLVNAVDTLEWAICGTYNRALDIGLGLTSTDTGLFQKTTFVAFMGRQPNPGPFLDFDVKGKYCSVGPVEFDIEDQALISDTNNRFIVELSDSNGSFSQPLILDSSKSNSKRFNLKGSIWGIGNYKMRIRSTIPDSIGPEKPIEIYPRPQRPQVFANNNFTYCNGDSLLLKISNPYPFANAVYRWSNGKTGDSIYVKSPDNYYVNVNAYGCSNSYWPIIVNEVPRSVNFPFNKNICGTLDSVKLITSNPGGYWTGPQIDSNGTFFPQSVSDTIFLRYRKNQLNGCHVDSTISIIQFKVQDLIPFKDSIICSYASVILPNQGLINEIWRGPWVQSNQTGDQYFTPFGEGIIKIYHEAGNSICLSRDTVIFIVRSLNHPYCKSGVDTLEILEMMVSGNTCTPNIGGFVVWAGWTEHKSDTSGPFTLQIIDSSGSFNSPLFSITQPNTFFKLPQNLPIGLIKLRVIKNSPLTIGPEREFRFFKTPEKPQIFSVGSLTFCSTTGLGPKLYVNKELGAEYRWSGPQIITADTIQTNTYGIYSVRGVQDLCYGEKSDDLTISVATFPNVSYFVPSQVCANSTPFSLIATSWGNWSGPYVDSATRKFYPGPFADTSNIRFRLRVGDCYFIKNFTIVQKPGPSITLDSSISFCPNFGSIPLQASPMGGLWSGYGLLPNNRFFLQNTGVYPLVYSATGTNGCVGKDTVQITVQDPNSPICQVSNKTQANTEKLSFWPNPAHNQLFISGANAGFSSVYIYNSLGQVVFSKHSIPNDTAVDLPASISKGIYFLKSTNGLSMLSEKLIIQ